ncbi:acyltransferase [Massilia sp. UMI-21]|nr:acyltransferase [Massilia sp. UMI-21]
MNDADNSLSQRIALLRFLMIFGIVLLHTPPYVPIAEVANNPFDLFKAFFQHAVFRTTVPVLTCISGFLLFRAGLDLNPAKLARKKFRTIVVPFLVFNLGLLAVALTLQQGLGVTLSNDMVPKDGKGWLDAGFGLTSAPINYPLNFLRDLVALMIAAPLLGWLLRHAPYHGLGIVVLIYQFNLDASFVLRDVMWPVFYVGGLAAVRGWNLRALDRYAPLCLALFLGLCAYVIAFRIANTNILRMVAPVLIWPAASLLLPTAFGRWLGKMSKFSFFVFLAHAPVLLAISIVYKSFAAHVPYPLYWVLSPVLTTALLVLIHMLAMRTMPGVFSFMIGTKAAPYQKQPAPLFQQT